LSRSLAEDYVDLPQALAPALAALMRSKTWDKPEQKLRCRKAIRRAELPLAEAFVLDRIVDTQLTSSPAEGKRYRELEQREGKEVQEMVITWEDALADRYAKGRAEGEARGRAEGEARGRAEGQARGRAEGQARGRAEGQARGRAEGELQATRRAIVLLARHRHEELPDGFEERLGAIHSLKRLYEILEQISDVASLEELDLAP